MSEFTPISISKLKVSGLAKPDAIIGFSAGLNAFVGASDTGKSYIFSVIDYLFGSSTTPKPNPFSDGYSRYFLELLLPDKSLLTIERILGEAEVNLFRSSIENASHETFDKRTKISGSDDSLSNILLETVGLSEKRIRADAYGKTQAVTFRTVAHLAMVDETRIITDISPALSGQYVPKTAEMSFLRLLLTGNDDSHLAAPAPNKKLRNAGLDGQIAILQQLIDEKGRKLETISVSPNEIELRLAAIQEGIQLETQFLVSTAETISSYEETRQKVWSEMETIRDRVLFLTEQRKRLILLREYYTSDERRLEAMLETGFAFEKLSGGQCAICGSLAESDTSYSVDSSLAKFRSACRAELDKIIILSRDLDDALKAFDDERNHLKIKESFLEDALADANFKIHEELKPRHLNATANLKELLSIQSALLRGRELKNEIESLNLTLSAATILKATKVDTLPKPHIDELIWDELSDEIEKTLIAWKYPLAGNIRFDVPTFDLIIGNQERGSMGKGYRAITHAAFVIGLMRYCRVKKLPHPGFVILDSPLNPFRGAVATAGTDAPINDEVKDAFYRDLASDTSGNQYIILENTEPPAELIPKMRYEQFTGNSKMGRSGFFPASEPK